MRLWHKDLISVLPRQQLLGQWRECCAIAHNIATTGTPNHMLVNKVILYPVGHFWKYGHLVWQELESRGYEADFSKFEQYFSRPYALELPDFQDLFKDWHNDRYLIQCYYNLQEKYDCGGFNTTEWNKIEDKVKGKINNG